MKTVVYGIILSWVISFWTGFAFAGTYNWNYKANDSDWNTSLRPVCKTDKDLIYMMKENGDKFVRAELEHADGIGLCPADKRGKRQRAEFATSERMNTPGVYEYSVSVRFNTPITQEAVFMQIHAKNDQCRKENGRTTHPPIKLRMRYNMEVVNLEPGHFDMPGHKDRMAFVKGMIKVGQWHDFKIVMDFKIGTSLIDIYLDGKQIANDFAVGTVNKCVRPWGKIGIYRERPRSGKWEDISIDYDNIMLKRIN